MAFTGLLVSVGCFAAGVRAELPDGRDVPELRRSGNAHHLVEPAVPGFGVPPAPSALAQRPEVEVEVALFERWPLEDLEKTLKKVWRSGPQKVSRRFNPADWLDWVQSSGYPPRAFLTPAQQAAFPGFTFRLLDYPVTRGTVFVGGELVELPGGEGDAGGMEPATLRVELSRNGCEREACVSTIYLERSESNPHAYYREDADPQRDEPVLVFDDNGAVSMWAPPPLEEAWRASAKEASADLPDWYPSHNPQEATLIRYTFDRKFVGPDDALLEEEPPVGWLHRDHGIWLDPHIHRNPNADPPDLEALLADKDVDAGSEGYGKGNKPLVSPGPWGDWDFAKVQDPDRYRNLVPPTHNPSEVYPVYDAGSDRWLFFDRETNQLIQDPEWASRGIALPPPTAGNDGSGTRGSGGNAGAGREPGRRHGGAAPEPDDDDDRVYYVLTELKPSKPKDRPTFDYSEPSEGEDPLEQGGGTITLVTAHRDGGTSELVMRVVRPPNQPKRGERRTTLLEIRVSDDRWTSFEVDPRLEPEDLMAVLDAAQQRLRRQAELALSQARDTQERRPGWVKPAGADAEAATEDPTLDQDDPRVQDPALMLFATTANGPRDLENIQPFDLDLRALYPEGADLLAWAEATPDDRVAWAAAHQEGGGRLVPILRASQPGQDEFFNPTDDRGIPIAQLDRLRSRTFLTTSEAEQFGQLLAGAAGFSIPVERQVYMPKPKGELAPRILQNRANQMALGADLLFAAIAADGGAFDALRGPWSRLAVDRAARGESVRFGVVRTRQGGTAIGRRDMMGTQVSVDHPLAREILAGMILHAEEADPDRVRTRGWLTEDWPDRPDERFLHNLATHRAVVIDAILLANGLLGLGMSKGVPEDDFRALMLREPENPDDAIEPDLRLALPFARIESHPAAPDDDVIRAARDTYQAALEQAYQGWSRGAQDLAAQENYVTLVQQAYQTFWQQVPLSADQVPFVAAGRLQRERDQAAKDRGGEYLARAERLAEIIRVGLGQSVQRPSAPENKRPKPPPVSKRQVAQDVVVSDVVPVVHVVRDKDGQVLEESNIATVSASISRAGQPVALARIEVNRGLVSGGMTLAPGWDTKNVREALAEAIADKIKDDPSFAGLLGLDAQITRGNPQGYKVGGPQGAPHATLWQALGFKDVSRVRTADALHFQAAGELLTDIHGLVEDPYFSDDARAFVDRELGAGVEVVRVSVGGEQYEVPVQNLAELVAGLVDAGEGSIGLSRAPTRQSGIIPDRLEQLHEVFPGLAEAAAASPPEDKWISAGIAPSVLEALRVDSLRRAEASFAPTDSDAINEETGPLIALQRQRDAHPPVDAVTAIYGRIEGQLDFSDHEEGRGDHRVGLFIGADLSRHNFGSALDAIERMLALAQEGSAPPEAFLIVPPDVRFVRYDPTPEGMRFVGYDPTPEGIRDGLAAALDGTGLEVSLPPANNKARVNGVPVRVRRTGPRGGRVRLQLQQSLAVAPQVYEIPD